MATDQPGPSVQPSPGWPAVSPEPAEKRSWHTARKVILTVLFILSFAIPLVVAAHWSGVFKREHQGAEQANDDLFPDSLSTGQGDVRVQIASDAALEPSAGTDFLAISWFKFKKVPANDERVVLFSKTETGAAKNGYALSVSGENGGIRPVIYWSGPDGGHWFRFTDLQVPTREWMMFAVSLRENRYLGLHVATASEPGKAEVRLLGGYDLESFTYVPNTLPLEIAPPGSARFYGRVGPLGIFHHKDLTSSLHDLLKDLARSPLSAPDLFGRDQIGAWWTGGAKDYGPHNLRVTIDGANGKGKR